MTYRVTAEVPCEERCQPLLNLVLDSPEDPDSPLLAALTVEAGSPDVDNSLRAPAFSNEFRR